MGGCGVEETRRFLSLGSHGGERGANGDKNKTKQKKTVTLTSQKRDRLAPPPPPTHTRAPTPAPTAPSPSAFALCARPETAGPVCWRRVGGGEGERSGRGAEQTCGARGSTHGSARPAPPHPSHTHTHTHHTHAVAVAEWSKAAGFWRRGGREMVFPPGGGNPLPFLSRDNPLTETSPRFDSESRRLSSACAGCVCGVRSGWGGGGSQGASPFTSQGESGWRGGEGRVDFLFSPSLSPSFPPPHHPAFLPGRKEGWCGGRAPPLPPPCSHTHTHYTHALSRWPSGRRRRASGWRGPPPPSAQPVDESHPRFESESRHLLFWCVLCCAVAVGGGEGCELTFLLCHRLSFLPAAHPPPKDVPARACWPSGRRLRRWG